MRRLGALERIALGKGIVAVGDNEVPPLGSEVVDETLDAVGTVVDVIGPVDGAYAVIDPVDDRSLVDRLDARLYLRDG